MSSGDGPGVAIRGARKPSSNNSNSWAHELRTIGVQSGYLVLTYPMDYARTLIQLGYEPFAPKETRGWLFRGTYLSLPNIFEYIKYIKNVDGLAGCYRGLGARLCQHIVANTVYRRVSERRPYQDKSRGDAYPQQYQLSSTRSGAWVRDTIGGMNEDFVHAVKKTGWDVVCVTASAIASQPFYVIAVRTMGEFVGRETMYSNVLQSMKHIYENEGISGFFSGLLPRVIGDVLYISISASLIYLTSSYLDKQPGIEHAAAMVSNLVASSVTYQYHVISSVMAVNNCGLVIGSFPHTRCYDGFYDCWKDLADKRQLKRGSNIVGRTFAGQTIIINGTKRPHGFYFGPLHPPGLGARDKMLSEILARPIN